jgi:membrane protein
MARPVRRLLRAVPAAAETYVRIAGGQRAAAIAYHVLFSLVPFLALLIAAFELLLSDSTQARLVGWLVGTFPLPEDLDESVAAAIESVTSSSAVGLVAVIALIWSASGMMASIRSAFRAVWATSVDRPYLRGKALDILLVGAAALLVMAAFGVSVVTQLLTNASVRVVQDLGGGAGIERLSALGQVVASTLLALLAFLLLFRVAPPVPQRLGDIVPGALVAAVGLGVSSGFFTLYLDRAASFDVYGSLGAALVLLLFVYVAAAVMVFGACVTAAWPAAGLPETAEAEPARVRARRMARGLVFRDPPR